MIKILQATYCGNFQIQLEFADHQAGMFDGHALLSKSGSLLDALRDEVYFQRFFVECGALCWPNGLELAPQVIYQRLADHGLLRSLPLVA